MVELRRRVGRTDQQLDVLVLWASERGLVHETDDTLALTERGEGTARSVYAEVRRARAAAVPKFSPYTEYVPRRWWPDKSSNP